MQGIDRGLANAWREFEEGVQQAMYYALLSDIFIFIAISVFVWCCCVFVTCYKKKVEDDLKLNKIKKQYYLVKSKKENLEYKRLSVEEGLVEEINKIKSF